MSGFVELLTGFFDVIHNFITGLGVTSLGTSYFLDIFTYTLILKLIVMPLFVVQQKSTRRMGELTPKVKELQERYKNNPQKLQEEQIKLYKELGVNPMMGCLPLLVSMPIFIAMFTVVSSYTGFNGASFLWIPDLGKYDPYYILPLLTGGIQYLSVMVMSKNMDADQQKMQKRMGIVMSVMFVFICFKYKAALAIYFIASSLIQMVQTMAINAYLAKKQEKEDAIKAEKAAEKAKRDAEEKAARRELHKKKKKKLAEGETSETEKCEAAADADKPKKKKKKKRPVEGGEVATKTDKVSE